MRIELKTILIGTLCLLGGLMNAQLERWQLNNQLLQALRGPALLSDIERFVREGASIHARDDAGNSVLHLAVLADRIDLAEFFLDQGADINAQNFSYATALILACQYVRPDIMELLLRRGAATDSLYESLLEDGVMVADREEAALENLARCFERNPNIADLLFLPPMDVNGQNRNGNTFLHLALMLGDKNMIMFLIRRDADINIPNNEGNTAVHLITDALVNFPDLFQPFFAHFVNMGIRNNEGNTPVHTALLHPEGRVMLNFCIFHFTVAINIQNHQGDTALHLAIRHQRLFRLPHIIISHVLNLGLQNLGLQNNRGDTIFHEAVRTADPAFVRTLMESAPFLFFQAIRNNAGQTFLELATALGNQGVIEALQAGMAYLETQSRPEKFLQTLFQSLMQKAPLEEIKALLQASVDAGIGLNVRACLGETVATLTLLHLAVCDYPEAVPLLIRHGADVDALTHQSDTPMHFAVRRRNIPLISLLIRYGANLVMLNNRQETPFHEAVRTGDIAVLNVLLNNDPMLDFNVGRPTPLELAQQRQGIGAGCPEAIIEALEAAQLVLEAQAAHVNWDEEDGLDWLRPRAANATLVRGDEELEAEALVPEDLPEIDPANIVAANPDPAPNVDSIL